MNNDESGVAESSSTLANNTGQQNRPTPPVLTTGATGRAPARERWAKTHHGATVKSFAQLTDRARPGLL